MRGPMMPANYAYVNGEIVSFPNWVEIMNSPAGTCVYMPDSKIKFALVEKRAEPRFRTSPDETKNIYRFVKYDEIPNVTKTLMLLIPPTVADG